MLTLQINLYSQEGGFVMSNPCVLQVAIFVENSPFSDNPNKYSWDRVKGYSLAKIAWICIVSTSELSVIVFHSLSLVMKCYTWQVLTASVEFANLNSSLLKNIKDFLFLFSFHL